MYFILGGTFMEQVEKRKKLWIIGIIGICLVLGLSIFAFYNATKLKQAKEENSKLLSDLENDGEKVDKLETEIKEKDSQIKDLEAKVEEAKPWFDMSEKEQERKIAEEKEKQEAEEAAAKKKEAEKKKKEEEKEKKGYETGITYEEIARTPDDYEGEKVKFKGKVVQVIEDDDAVQLRIAVDDDYDKMIFVEYDASIIDSRVLEDDQITIMGISLGLISYESTMGGKITIPAISVDKVEQ